MSNTQGPADVSDLMVQTATKNNILKEKSSFSLLFLIRSNAKNLHASHMHCGSCGSAAGRAYALEVGDQVKDKILVRSRILGKIQIEITAA